MYTLACGFSKISGTLKKICSQPFTVGKKGGHYSIGDDVSEDKKVKPIKKRDNEAGTCNINSSKCRTSLKKCIFLIVITYRFNRLAALAVKECR